MFSSNWMPLQADDWERAQRKLLRELESAGCSLGAPAAMSGCSRIELHSPGPDLFLAGKVPSVLATLRPWLWESAWLELDPKKRRIQFRWIYWSPVQIFSHALITILFLLGTRWGTSEMAAAWVACALTNLLPLLLSAHELGRLRKVFRASGFTPHS